MTACSSLSPSQTEWLRQIVQLTSSCSSALTLTDSGGLNQLCTQITPWKLWNRKSCRKDKLKFIAIYVIWHWFVWNVKLFYKPLNSEDNLENHAEKSFSLIGWLGAELESVTTHRTTGQPTGQTLGEYSANSGPASLVPVPELSNYITSCCYLFADGSYIFSTDTYALEFNKACNILFKILTLTKE